MKEIGRALSQEIVNLIHVLFSIFHSSRMIIIVLALAVDIALVFFPSGDMAKILGIIAVTISSIGGIIGKTVRSGAPKNDTEVK